MLKSTKIVAGFGAVAALSVAALPVASFAATETNYSGQVSLSATLQDEISIKIDNQEMATSGTATSGTAVEFLNAEATPGINLSAGHSYITGNKTQITVVTNVPNTYTLSTSGSDLTNANSNTIALAGYGDGTSAGLNLGATPTNGADYSGSSKWGMKISGVDKSGNPISLSTSSGDSLFKDAATYQISNSDTVVDYAQVTGSKISNTYNVDYGIGINEDQPSGVYTGAAFYSVTHIQN